MSATQSAPLVVHRTATIRLRLTRRQAHRCYRLLRSAGDVWAWLLDSNRMRLQRGDRPLTNYQELCRELARTTRFGELSTVGARSVLRRYSDAWHQAARRRNLQQPAGFPRRKHSLVPVRCYHGTFGIRGRRVRLPVAKGAPELWVRLARPIPYSVEQVRAVTLVANGGTALAGRDRRCPRPSPPGPGACGRGGPRHHPSLRTGHRTGGSAGVRSGAPGRELPAPTRPAGPPREGGAACPQAWTAGVAEVAPSPAQRATCGGAPSPARPPGPP
jgi:hypothetical protein